MLRLFKLSDGRLIEQEPGKPADLLVYVSPDEKEKSQLINEFHIDEHTLRSSLDPEELGRVEFESNHMAAIIKRPKRYNSKDDFLFKVTSAGLFLFSDKLVMIVGDECPGLENRVFSKMHSCRDIFLRIIFDSLVHFEEHLKVIHKISDEIEQVINHAVSNKDLLNMFKLSKSLVYYLDAINSNSKMIERVKMNAAKLGFDQEAHDLLDDLIIESNQCYQQADSYSEVIGSMIDAWASLINNNLNIRIKRLTVVSVCIMTPTLVVSLFSMNVPLPLPQNDTLFSFWLVMGMAAVSVLALLLVGYLKKL